MTILIMSGKKKDKIQHPFYDQKNCRTTCVKCVKTEYYGLNKDKLNNETK